MNKYIPAAARLLLAQIFLITGLVKVMLVSKNPDFYAQFTASLGAGIPYFVAPLTFIIEIGAGFALFFGFKTRGAAWVLAAYSLFLALGLHSDWSHDPKEPVLFMLYMALAGGLLAITALAPTACSLDNLKKK